jgi:hypothetical protein
VDRLLSEEVEIALTSLLVRRWRGGRRKSVSDQRAQKAGKRLNSASAARAATTRSRRKRRLRKRTTGAGEADGLAITSLPSRGRECQSRANARENCGRSDSRRSSWWHTPCPEKYRALALKTWCFRAWFLPPPARRCEVGNQSERAAISSYSISAGSAPAGSEDRSSGPPRRPRGGEQAPANRESARGSGRCDHCCKAPTGRLLALEPESAPNAVVPNQLIPPPCLLDHHFRHGDRRPIHRRERRGL